jgi:hypothetical protein
MESRVIKHLRNNCKGKLTGRKEKIMIYKNMKNEEWRLLGCYVVWFL